MLLRRRGIAPRLRNHTRMHEQFGIGMCAGLVSELVAVDPGVYVAFAGPHMQVLAAGHPLHVCTEELVRQNNTSRSGSMDATTSTAFDEVQQMSVSALTAAVVLT